MSRAQLTSTVEQNTGGAVAPYVAGKNKIINGDFGIWQRGTTTTSRGYATADRWNNQATGTTTISQESSDLPTGFQYGIKFVTSASSSFGQFKTFLERGTVIPMRGQVVTISAYVKISGGYTGSWIGQVYYSNSSDSSASVTTQVGSNVAIASSATSSWTRVSFQATIPTDAVGLGVFFVPDSVQASGVTVRMTGVQLEVGSVATPFTTATGTLSGELAACQRYYWRQNWDAQTTYAIFGQGSATSTTIAYCQTPYPVQMRVKPTAIDFPAVGTYFQCLDAAAGGATMTALSFDANQTTSSMGFLSATVAAGLTQYRPYVIRGLNSTAAYLGWSAEL